ncbi:MAG TPA: hypothetical protein VJB63_01000 [Patescibacteria group bacterium]|nr:hypothetical protein [Patescibacteria group bacterium]
MKKIISRYTFRLIKENYIYLISLFVFILLLSLVLPGQITDYQTSKKENQQLVEEIAQLEKKKVIIASFDSDEIDQLIKTLNTILPQTEDYFSIFYALDVFSQQTNFTITGLGISFDAHSSEELTVDVQTAGSSEAFITFLENYIYKSGRLITLDSITYEPSTPATSLSLHFYSKKIEASEVKKPPVIEKNRFELVRRIHADLNDLFPPFDDSAPSTEYTAKQNPFSAR